MVRCLATFLLKVTREATHHVQGVLHNINSDFSSETVEIEAVGWLTQSEEKKTANQETYIR